MENKFFFSISFLDLEFSRRRTELFRFAMVLRRGRLGCSFFFIIRVCWGLFTGFQKTTHQRIFFCKGKNVWEYELTSNIHRWYGCTFELHFPFSNRVHLHCWQVTKIIIFYIIRTWHTESSKTSGCVSASESGIWTTLKTVKDTFFLLNVTYRATN